MTSSGAEHYVLNAEDICSTSQGICTADKSSNIDELNAEEQQEHQHQQQQPTDLVLNAIEQLSLQRDQLTSKVLQMEAELADAKDANFSGNRSGSVRVNAAPKTGDTKRRNSLAATAAEKNTTTAHDNNSSSGAFLLVLIQFPS